MNTNDKITKLIKTETNSYYIKKLLTILAAISLIIIFSIGSFHVWYYKTTSELIFYVAFYIFIGLPIDALIFLEAASINKKRYEETNNYINRKINFYKKYNIA